MKIYDRDGAPNTARIRIVLAEKGLEDQVEFVGVDLIGAQHKQVPFLNMNPIGKIPVLELDDGLIISESTAITEYLDNLDGKPTLTGRTPREKALVHMMQRRVEMLLLEPLDDFFHYGTPGLGKELAPYRMPEWSGRHEWGKRRGDMASRGLPYFNDVLEQRPFVAGETFSMADITLYISLIFGDIAGLSIPSELTALIAWREKVAELPSVKHRSGQNMLPVDLERLMAASV
jgi:glutathione S-transferase